MSDVTPKTSPFSLLSEGCIANIISFTSPKDVCRMAAVSLGFKSAADSDLVWERFLPPEIVSRHPPLEFYTKKQLYFLLRHMIIEFNEKIGKTSYTLGARKLQIGSSDDPKHWKWTSVPGSRFAEVAKLESIDRLEIRGTVQARMLSPKTTYVAWLVYRFTVIDDGLDVPSKASIKIVKEDGSETEGERNTIYLVIPKGRSLAGIGGRLSWAVEDDWYEIELGEFVIGEGDSFDIHIEVSETELLNEKKGLVIEGIALRPKYKSQFADLSQFAEFCWKRPFGKLDDLIG